MNFLRSVVVFTAGDNPLQQKKNVLIIFLTHVWFGKLFLTFMFNNL